MNFNDRDIIVLIYNQIFIKNINIDKINIDYERLERLYNDPKTFVKYKIIINDILKVSRKNDSNSSSLIQDIKFYDHNNNSTEHDLDQLINDLDFNKSFILNFQALKKIAIILETLNSLDYKALLKINNLIKSLLLQAVYNNEPELEFLLLRNLILLIVKFGIYNPIEKTGLINLDYKILLSLTNNDGAVVPSSNNYTYIIDSRLEIIYLLLKNSYNFFKHNYNLLFKSLKEKSSSSSSSHRHFVNQPAELKVKWLKMITNLIIENKIYISDTFFEKKLLASYIKLIPDINIKLNDPFNKELINSIRLLLENYYPTLDHIANKEYFSSLIRLLEVTRLKEKNQFDDKLNINLLKLLIIIGLDLQKYPRTRVLTLFEKEHLSKLANPNNLSPEYKSLIIKTLFYTHNVQYVQSSDENDVDPLIKAYNNIEDKSTLDDCPTPMQYKLEATVEIKDDIRLNSDDLGRINSIYLRNSNDLGFKELVKKNCDYKRIELFITKAPDSKSEYYTDIDSFENEDIGDEVDSLKMEFGQLMKNKSSFSRPPSVSSSSTSSLNLNGNKKSIMNLSLGDKLKSKKLFGIKM
ncbi:hypothetical protein HANVADRAFT_52602 [Hanseniaspora valbyensis NRRL Y-1626]|uniref:Uncharacterized protein n=1 Tax=Hanseniaspora valbyensis NRRL Y-1626 TaxID=766949 RepID=A0A1B7TE92_9ASCO|nr:hypothetical protein HANVADRAFT_52602 [Hanseniaspora valbyensis NRRL Y-1626]